MASETINRSCAYPSPLPKITVNSDNDAVRLGSITSRCSGKEPALLPRTLLGEERRPDSRRRRKSSLPSGLPLKVMIEAAFWIYRLQRKISALSKENNISSSGVRLLPPNLHQWYLYCCLSEGFPLFASLADLIDVWHPIRVSPSWVWSSSWNLSARPGGRGCFCDLTVTRWYGHAHSCIHFRTSRGICAHRLHDCHVLNIRDLHKLLNYWSSIFA